MTGIAGYLLPEAWLSSGGGPLYVQLRKRIETGIATGLLAPEMPLPPEREIASLTGLSRVTVRKAIADLVERHLVVQRQGSGSFVAQPQPRMAQSLSRLTSYTEDMTRRGFRPDVRWLERGLFVPSPDEVLTLGLGMGEQVARLSRLRLADDRPMAIERASLPADVLPDPLAVTTSLYECLAGRGLRPVRAVQRISAINLSPKEAELLGVQSGEAGLKVERIGLLREGRAIELTRTIYRGDTYDFIAELRQPDGAA